MCKIKNYNLFKNIFGKFDKYIENNNKKNIKN